MAISTNLLANIGRQKKARDRVKAIAEDLRLAQSYLFWVGGVAEQLAAGGDDAELKEPGLWVEWHVTTRDGKRHTEQMLICRTKEHYHENA